jgi:type IV pilus assembly protein PilV
MTTIETLVAALITCSGLLGIAALQLVSLRDNAQASVRIQASILTSDILERMRANRADALRGDYDVPLGALSKSSNPIARTDVNQWKSLVSHVLPHGDAHVERSGDRVRVTVQWTAHESITSSITTDTGI